MGDEYELTWTLGGDGGLYASNGTLRLGSAASGDAMELRDAKQDKSHWRLEEVKDRNYARRRVSNLVPFQSPSPAPGQRLSANNR